MLTQNLTETQHGKCIITDIPVATLKIVVDFMYGLQMEERIRVHPKSVYKAADKYQMNRLKWLCFEHLTNTVSVENAASRYIFCQLYDELKAVSWTGLKFVRKNF